MHDRARLLVAFLLHGREEIEIDVLRRMLHSSEIARIAPHITLVPPVNVARERLGEIGYRIEAAVTAVEPVPLELRGVDTFEPQAHVLFLPVSGALEQLGALRDRCLSGVGAKREARPFVPHVTIKSHASAALVASTRLVMEAFTCPITVDRVAVLERDGAIPNGSWTVRDEFVLGSARLFGRGGREITCTHSTLVNDDDRRFLADHDPDGSAGHGVMSRDAREARDQMVIRARVAGALVGLCVVQRRETRGEIRALVVNASHRREGIGSQVLRYVDQIATSAALREMSVTCDATTAEFFGRLGFAPPTDPSRPVSAEFLVRSL